MVARIEFPMLMRFVRVATALLSLAALSAARPLPPALAQEPIAWGPALEFHTFSIVAVDPATRETGVAVTTRNPCVGNAVPWVRAGVGAVATQGGTRVEYGPELLDLLAKGVAPNDGARSTRCGGCRSRAAPGRGHWHRWSFGAVDRSRAERRRKPRRLDRRGVGPHLRRARQFAGERGGGEGGCGGIPGERGLAAASRRSAHRGLERGATAWRRRASRRNAVGRRARGRSAARPVPTPRRADRQHQRVRTSRAGQGTAPNLRHRERDAGVQNARAFIGRDVLQLKIMLHALGFFRPGEKEIDARAPQANLYTPDVIEAVDKFRSSQGWQTTVPGYVDARTDRTAVDAARGNRPRRHGQAPAAGSAACEMRLRCQMN